MTARQATRDVCLPNNSGINKEWRPFGLVSVYQKVLLRMLDTCISRSWYQLTTDGRRVPGILGAHHPEKIQNGRECELLFSTRFQAVTLSQSMPPVVVLATFPACHSLTVDFGYEYSTCAPSDPSRTAPQSRGRHSPPPPPGSPGSGAASRRTCMRTARGPSCRRCVINAGSQKCLHRRRVGVGKIARPHGS